MNDLRGGAMVWLRVKARVAGRVTYVLLGRINWSYIALGTSRVRILWLKSAV